MSNNRDSDDALSPAELELRAEHRKARTEQAAAQAAAGQPHPHDVPRIDVTGWTSRHPNSPLARALRAQAENPELAAQVERQIEADRQQVAEEVGALRRQNRFRSYAAHRPAAYTTATYDDLNPRNPQEAKVRGWWKSGAKTLLIAGLPGRGKTHGAYAICNEVAAADRDGTTALPVMVRAYSIHTIRDMLRPPETHVARDEVASGRRARETAELRTCDLLLIDDITAVKVTEWLREEVHKLLDARVNADRRTIITLNGTSQKAIGGEMVEGLGAPIVSRLRDNAVFVWLEGVDRRDFSNWNPFA